MQKIDALCVFGISALRWQAGSAAEIESCQSIDRQNCCDGARFVETARFQSKDLKELGRILSERSLESLFEARCFHIIFMIVSMISQNYALSPFDMVDLSRKTVSTLRLLILISTGLEFGGPDFCFFFRVSDNVQPPTRGPTRVEGSWRKHCVALQHKVPKAKRSCGDNEICLMDKQMKFRASSHGCLSKRTTPSEIAICKAKKHTHTHHAAAIFWGPIKALLR